MKVTILGIDLAKNVFRLHGVDAEGRPVLRKQLRRAQLLPFMRQLTPCLVGLEACHSAHYWGRELEKLGHAVRLMNPRFIKPYLKGEKNDANDAAAICEAVSRPSMRFVPVKNPAQQDIQALHGCANNSSGTVQRWSTKRAGYWARMGSWWHKESAVFVKPCQAYWKIRITA